MKAVVQRSGLASVTVEGKTVGQIDHGLVVLVGVTHEDSMTDAKYLAEKIANLRIFEDDSQKMNLSVKDAGGAILSISQFTLYGDCRKGRRPNFMEAAKPDIANELYEKFNRALEEQGLTVETGVFGAMMDVQLTNQGPVTLIIESQK
ncbi:D-aminoacyl-tRNA deacylase [Pseudalkalibacillus caeni]|uniref:D-aminoacyl-tRNA deacylase n=1 Tax=Exobacillus caeni TaxID=2574798 RepID=A0A5R9F8B1_9BACL|nr:D-aminoacyl-tRNA deacylase [Pseudalkalibacillus caeni]TLS39281.1 D-tyrosyl-tRNA(Tyr) deacylase [Pseudalkalibacillus caeni]